MLDTFHGTQRALEDGCKQRKKQDGIWHLNWHYCRVRQHRYCWIRNGFNSVLMILSKNPCWLMIPHLFTSTKLQVCHTTTSTTEHASQSLCRCLQCFNLLSSALPPYPLCKIAPASVAVDTSLYLNSLLIDRCFNDNDEGLGTNTAEPVGIRVCSSNIDKKLPADSVSTSLAIHISYLPNNCFIQEACFGHVSVGWNLTVVVCEWCSDKSFDINWVIGWSLQVTLTTYEIQIEINIQ